MEFEYFRALKKRTLHLFPTKKKIKNKKTTLIVPLYGYLEINITFPEKFIPLNRKSRRFVFLELYFVEDRWLRNSGSNVPS